MSKLDFSSDNDADINSENTIIECAYGEVSAFDILSNSNDYTLLKEQFQKINTFEERHFYSTCVARNYPLETLEKWVQDEPDSADALLCFGARLVQWSWMARGYGVGKNVSKEKWENFYLRLEKTKNVLLTCAEKMPSDPTPWAYLIIVSTWYSDDIDTRTSYFNEAIKRDPYNWLAHMHMIIALSKKWGGDNEQMVIFARDASNNAPEGSDLPAILIKAHLENWKYINLFEENNEKAAAYIHSNDIQSEALNAYQRSLGSEEHNKTASSIFVRYNSSAWFWVTRDQKKLKQDLQILGNTIEDIHWRWSGTEGELQDAKEFAKLA